MSTINLLYQREYRINDKISVVIPTVGEILENEDEYYNIVSMITSMPIDFQVQLDDIGIDYTKIDAWGMFLLFFNVIRSSDTKLVFGDLDLDKLQIMENKENGEIVLADYDSDIVIDRVIHDRIATILRKIHHLTKNNRRPGNDEAKRYMLERERIKLKRN